jgi:type IV pilus assembly protein PilM
MQLKTKNKNAVVGLDIEAASIAAAEVQLNGAARVAGAATAPLHPGMVDDGEVVDAERLADALAAMFAREKLSKQVRIGVANQRLAMRIVRLPLIEDPAELDTAVRFQAQDELPMPLDQAVLDFQVVQRFDGEDGIKQMDVAVVAARRDMVSGFVEAARRAGLRPVGIDLSAFALVRALSGAQPGLPSQDPTGLGEPGASTVLFCNLGALANLAVARGSACAFARVAPFGLESIARNLAERQGLDFEHARQWLFHVGLVEPVETIEGDREIVAAARETLEDGAAKLIDELRLSLDFYGSREGAPPVEQVVFSGPGATIAGLTQRVGEGTGQPFTVSRPRGLSHLGEKQASRLTVAYGLAIGS